MMMKNQNQQHYHYGAARQQDSNKSESDRAKARLANVNFVDTKIQAGAGHVVVQVDRTSTNNRPFDNIVCTIGQKLPDSIEMSSTSNNNRNLVCAESNNHNSTDNYYEKMYEIDLHSGSSESASDSSLNSGWELVGNVGNGVTCSITSVQQACAEAPRRVPCPTNEYAEVAQCTCADCTSNTAQTYSCASPRQILHSRNIPIPTLSIINSDGTIKMPANENELDSLDLTLFEKRSPSGHHLDSGDADHESLDRSLVRPRKIQRNNYWLDAGNEFEFISAESILKKAAKNQQCGSGVGRLNSALVHPADGVGLGVDTHRTDTIMEEDCEQQQPTLRSASNPRQFDTSYDKAICSVAAMNAQFNKRRGSLPLTMTAGIVHVHDPGDYQHNHNQASSSSASSSLSSTSRLVNFFSKRSFKAPSANPLLNRAKSANKLDIRTTSQESVDRRNNQSAQRNTAVTAQLINAQSLHPSVINNQHGFVTTSSDGSTQYYSCKTRSERDTWLHAIQQSIHHPEKPRIENFCHIWVLEGKDVGKSGHKRYHCEICLDDKLCGRTNGKIKDQLLFWGEEFVFSEIGEKNELNVTVWRKESGKKHGSKQKKEKKELIGSVKIPLKALASRHLVEKWYPLSVESTKQKPTLRLKCKYESIHILPMSCYEPLLQYVQENYKIMCEHLEPLLSVKGKEDLADALTYVLHHQSIAKKFVADLALAEILKGADDKLTFRGNSIATKSMESYLKLLGPSYLESTLAPFIEQFQNCDLYDCEVDPMRIQHITHLSRNQSNLRMCVDNIWRSILGGIDLFPSELKECFCYCRQELKRCGRAELTGHLISASVFLRYLCPAILSPSLFHITSEYPNEKSARNLMLIAKVVQTLANFTRFQGKESYMEFINDYIEKEAETMTNFLMRISAVVSPTTTNQTQSVRTTVDLGKWMSILASLLAESIDKISANNEKFKTLEEILKKLQTFPAPTTPPPLPPLPPMPRPVSQHQGLTPAYAIGNVIRHSAIPLNVTQHFKATSPEPQTASSGYQSQSPVQSFSAPLNSGFSNEEVLGIDEIGLPNVTDLQQRLTPMSTQTFSSSSGSDDDSYGNTTTTRPIPKRPTTNPLLTKPYFKSTAALHRGSHPVHSTRQQSSSDSDSGIANHGQRSRKIRYRRSPDGCQEPVERSLEEYENEMLELRQAMEILQSKLNRAEERLFGQPPARPRSTVVVEQERKSTTREVEMEGLLQRLLSAEEEMKREQELLSALDQKQKLIDAQEQKITHLDTVNTQLITALSKIHSSLQQRQPDSPRHPQQQNDVTNNNSTIVTITAGQLVHDETRRSMSPDSLNGSAGNDSAGVRIGEQDLKLLADMKSSSC